MREKSRIVYIARFYPILFDNITHPLPLLFEVDRDRLSEPMDF